MRSASRRALIGNTMAGALVAAAPTPAAAAAVDPHPAWEREWKALLAWCDGPAPGGRQLRDLWQYRRLVELEGLLGRTPARTLAGALAQLRVAAHWCDGLIEEEHEEGLAGAIATLERLAAREARA